MIGTTVSHYRILEKLGEGGMGVVYKAEDTTLKRTVALKFLPSEMTRDPKAQERFLREARAAAVLNHPNICTVHEIEEDGGHTFIAMELVEGETLNSRMDSGALDVELALDIAIQVADGLREAHDKGTVHRDIKPSNIMVTSGGQAKIMDFGVARLAGGSQLTKAGTTLGTVAYMSPEQACGREVDHRTDIWSLGVVLYEAVTGRRPFRGDRDQVVLHSIVNNQPERLSTALPGVPESLVSVVDRMLSKTPESRYQTAQDLLADLEAVLLDPSWSHETRQLPSRLRPVVARALAALPSDAPSIAVLPFTDMSPERDQEYFADGLSEELLSALAGLRGLRVAARTSAFSFKGKQDDIRGIGRKLGVTTVLEGSVRRAGKRVRINAQLTNVGDGFHLWSRSYDHELEDIFAIQEDIARSVAQTLRGTLLGDRESAPRSPTWSAEAFSLALRARHHHLTYSEESLERATACLQQAVALDPDYAAAWTGLALTYATRALLLHIPLEEGYSLARDAVEHALASDPELAHAHCMLSHIQSRHDWDFAAAEASAERALALEPGSCAALDAAANMARLLGRFDEAIALGRRAVELDPLNSRALNNFGIDLYCAGRFSEAEAVYERAVELNPRNPNPPIGLGNVYMEQGKWEAALEKYEAREPGPVLVLFCRAVAFAALGRQEEADAALQELIDEHSEAGAFQIAEIFATRGEVDEAFAWLERSYDCRDLGLADVKTSPRLKPLYDDPRWEALLTRLGLPS